MANVVSSPPPSRPRVAFAMDQIAGHVTRYHNLRGAVDDDGSLDPRWIEVDYYSESGRLERLADAVRIVPGYVRGVSRGAIEMRRGLAAVDKDVIFTNASIALFFVRRFRATPTMFDFDSTPVQLDAMPDYTPTPDPAPLAKLKFVLQRRLFESVVALQAWSHWAARSVVDDYGIDSDKVFVNPPGVHLDRWQPVERSSPGNDGPIRVLFVGSDFARKGGHDLLSWHAASGRSDIEIDLVTREPVDVRPGVRVHDDLTPNSPELLELYRRAHVFVLPSRGECFGIAAIEAMATGLPVVQSTVGGSADIVDDGVSGLLVAPERPGELGAAIESIVDDTTRWGSMSRRGREIATERFDVRANAAVTIERLHSLAAAASAD
ncbi:MAG: glycosyltransferase family 4 protein [Actinomycetota bacterium]